MNVNIENYCCIEKMYLLKYKQGHNGNRFKTHLFF